MTERDPKDYLEYTPDIDILVTALRKIKEYAEACSYEECIPAWVDEALQAIGLVP